MSVSTEARRTLVKSPPELWAELSDPVALGRHLGDLGEIRIARVQAEQRVEWEAEFATGTVALEPSGWGTRVTLTIARELPAEATEPAAAPEVEAAPAPAAEAAAAPEASPEPEPAPAARGRGRLLTRLLRRWRRRPEAEPAPPVSEPPPPAAAPPDAVGELAAELTLLEEAMAEQDAALLTAALDRLGAAHHRPFSRG